MFSSSVIPGYCGGHYIGVTWDRFEERNSTPAKAIESRIRANGLDTILPSNWLDDVEGVKSYKFSRYFSIACSEDRGKLLQNSTILDDMEYMDKYLDTNGIDWKEIVKSIPFGHMKDLYNHYNGHKLSTLHGIQTQSRRDNGYYCESKQECTISRENLPSGFLLFSETCQDQIGDTICPHIFQESLWLMYIIYKFSSKIMKYNLLGEMEEIRILNLMMPEVKEYLPLLYDPAGGQLLLNFDMPHIINKNYPHNVNMLTLSKGYSV